MGFFVVVVVFVFSQGWSWTMMLLTSWMARITGVSHSTVPGLYTFIWAYCYKCFLELNCISFLWLRILFSDPLLLSSNITFANISFTTSHRLMMQTVWSRCLHCKVAHRTELLWDFWGHCAFLGWASFSTSGWLAPGCCALVEAMAFVFAPVLQSCLP
jgi:hypothetical protein